MFINIITPCSRPENLQKISESINIPKQNYRWIIVFDMDNFPNRELIPSNCETYLHRNHNSTVGHSQRNFALELIEKGHIYMNDDDTTIHENLWENIKGLNHDFISFSQSDKNGNLRLRGNLVKVNNIDSHNFIVSKDLMGNTRWIIDRYDADGYFAQENYEKAIINNRKVIFIDRVLSVYNSLR
jgi:hypothetical protein